MFKGRGEDLMILVHFNDVLVTRYRPEGAILAFATVVHGRLIAQTLEVAKRALRFEQFRVSDINLWQRNVIYVSAVRCHS